MKNTDKNTDALTAHLKEINMKCGEVISNKYTAECIQDFEYDHGVAFTDEEILKATRCAAESFIDSMQENERDTEMEVRNGIRNGYPIDCLEDRLARWEAMRPSVIRKNEIRALQAMGYQLPTNQGDHQTMKKQIETTTIGQIRALQACNLPIPRILCDNGENITWANFELPEVASAWLARHPEANIVGRPEGRLGRHLIACYRRWNRRATIASVLASPEKHRAAELRAYRVRLGLVRFA